MGKILWSFCRTVNHETAIPWERENNARIAAATVDGLYIYGLSAEINLKTKISLISKETVLFAVSSTPNFVGRYFSDI